MMRRSHHNSAIGSKKREHSQPAALGRSFMDETRPQHAHNHEIPSDSLVQNIAQSLLPSSNDTHTNSATDQQNAAVLESLRPHQRAAVLAATASSSSSSSSAAAAETTNTTKNDDEPVSRWTQLVQSVLWKEFGTLSQNDPQDSQGNTNSANNNKKRKKRKKKKKASAAETIMDENETPTVTHYAPDSNANETDAPSSPKASSSSKSPSTTNNTLQQPNPETSSSSSFHHMAIPQCPKVFPHYRDWWIQFYLDRSNNHNHPETNQQRSNNTEQEIADLQAFFQGLAHKTRVPEHNGTKPHAPSTSKKHKHAKSKNGTAATLSSSNTTTTLSSSLCFIPQASILHAVREIQCGACRQAVQRCIQQATCLPLHALDQYRLSGAWLQQHHHHSNHSFSIPTTGRNNDNIDDDYPEPFDYVAMEEGNAVEVSNNNDPPQLPSDPATDIWALVAIPHPQSGETEGWRLQKVPKDATTTTRIQPSAMTMTETDFTFLLRECYLLPAVSYDTWVGATPVTEEHYRTIIDKVQERHEDIMTKKKITPNRTKCLEVLQQLANLDEIRVATTACVKLSDANALTTDISNSMLQLVLQLTRAYQSIVTHWNYTHAQLSTPSDTTTNSTTSTTTPWLPFPSYLLKQVSTIVALWKTYLKCHQRMMDAVHVYEQGIMGLADPRGTIQQAAFNAEFRQLLRTHLEIKAHALLEMIDEIRIQLDEQKDAYETPRK